VIGLTLAPGRPGAPAARSSRVTVGQIVVRLANQPVALGAAAPLPSFHDWRAAYLGRDGLLHVVPLAGGRDEAPSILPGLDRSTIAGPAAAPVTAMAPNGRLLAYMPGPPGAGPGALIVASLAATLPPGPFSGADQLVGVNNLRWSPDSAALAFNGYAAAAQGVYILRVASGRVDRVPGTQTGLAGTAEQVLGWIDASHLAVLVVPSGGPSVTGQANPPTRLGSLEVASGRLRSIAAVSGGVSAHLSPDGRLTLVESGPGAPLVETIETATGHVRTLPGITRVAGGGAWAATAWEAGTHTVAVTVATGRVALLDLDSDSATLGMRVEYALGWAPTGGHLLVGMPAVPRDDRISALGTLDAGSGAPVVLTTSAVAFWDSSARREAPSGRHDRDGSHNRVCTPSLGGVPASAMIVMRTW
jgi:hypothetical protein